MEHKHKKISVMTCTHVMNGTKYEYVEAEGRTVETFTCSNCLDRSGKYQRGEIAIEESVKDVILVCRECFMEKIVNKK